MYEKRKREKKEFAQAKISHWLCKKVLEYPALTKGQAITLAGPDPMNAAKSIEVLNPSEIHMYELDLKTYQRADGELRANGFHNNTQGIKLWNRDIYKVTHPKCSCFYYDFCCSHKNVDWGHLALEFGHKMKKGETFSVVLTLSMRGKDCTKNDTAIMIREFNTYMKNAFPSYKILRMKKPVTYHGGETGRGAPMFVWAGVYTKEKPQMAKNIRKRHPHLFNQSSSPEDHKPVRRISKLKEKEMKPKTSPKIEVTYRNSDELKEFETAKKEMIHVLLSRKKRNYTNEDIASVMAMSTRQIGAMAAWHHPNLKAKRK